MRFWILDFGIWIFLFVACGQKDTTEKIYEGDILWQSESIGENIEASPVVDEKGNIYTTGGGKLWCFSKEGKVKWSTCPLDEGSRGVDQEYPYPLGVASSPAISPDGRYIYITGYAGVFAFRLGDGKLLWKKIVFDNFYEFSEKEFEESKVYLQKYKPPVYPFPFATTPAISADGSRLYAGGGENDYPCDHFYCIDTDDGSLVWTYEMIHPPQQVEDGNYTRGFLGGASIGPKGNIFIASMHGWLVSLSDNGDSYTENWAYNVGAEMRMPPSIDSGGYIYVGSSSTGGYVHKVDSQTGKSAGGNWPVKTNASEVFANISIGNDGTIFVNSEDYSLWAFNPDGTVKWNNVKFDHWGSDPLIRENGTIIVTSQINGAARVVCIRDAGDKGIIEWASGSICDSLAFNESNVNIGPDGTIYVHSGVYPPVALFAVRGNGQGLSKTSPWPKYMGNIQNNGRPAIKDKASSEKDKAQIIKAAEINPHIHDPAELQYENDYFMTFSTGKGIRSWYREKNDSTWYLANILDKPGWWDDVFPDNNGYFWAPCVPEKWVMYYSFEADADYASAIGRAVATGIAPNLKWKDDGPVLIMPACRDEGTSCPVAIDPSVYSDEKGDMYMAFGSGTSGIWIVELDKETGHLNAEAAKGFSEDNKAFHRVAFREHGDPRGPTNYIEAPYVYKHPDIGYFYLFVNWGQCCSGLNSTYQIMVGRSKSPTGPFLDKNGNNMVDQGGTIILKTEGRYIGPGHAGIYRHSEGRFAFSFHYYDGEAEGKARLAVRELHWNESWPVVSKTDYFPKTQ
jgi:arabinan endo-1,5-alpha-L-arabinosidase